MELDENKNPIEENPEVQSDPEKEALKQQIAKLEGMVKQMGGQMKMLAQQKAAPVADPNQPKGAELYKNLVRETLQKYGQDPNADNWRGWDGLLADLLHGALESRMKEIMDFKESVTNAIYGIEDEVGLLNFLGDPANAKLDRSILPELRETYNSKKYWQKPEGHEGDWNGWSKAYEDFSKKMAKFGGQPAARPAQPKPAMPGMTYPREPARVLPGQGNGSISAKYREDNPDLNEILEEPGGSTALLAGLVQEEE
jgi:hypothetical protein